MELKTELKLKCQHDLPPHCATRLSSPAQSLILNGQQRLGHKSREVPGTRVSQPVRFFCTGLKKQKWQRVGPPAMSSCQRNTEYLSIKVQTRLIGWLILGRVLHLVFDGMEEISDMLPRSRVPFIASIHPSHPRPCGARGTMPPVRSSKKNSHLESNAQQLSIETFFFKRGRQGRVNVDIQPAGHLCGSFPCCS